MIAYSFDIICTLLSLIKGMIPFWIYTLGKLLMMTEEAELEVTVPFTNIITSLIGIIVPLCIGIVIQRYRPEWARIMLKWLRPVVLVFIIFMFTFAIWANLYVFRLFTWQLCVAGACLPYLGFILGGFIAYITCRPRSHISAICLETGIQNTGIAVLLMKLSLPQPDADMSIVGPVMVSMLTPIPLGFLIAIVEFKRCRKSRQKRQQELLEPVKYPDVDDVKSTTDDIRNENVPLNEKELL